MDCTNCDKECAFVKSGFCETDKRCPFYVESWWQCKDEKNPRLISDCYPKRATIQQNNIENRQLDTQSQIVELRNKFENIESLLFQILEKSNEYANSQKLEMTSKHIQDDVLLLNNNKRGE